MSANLVRQIFEAPGRLLSYLWRQFKRDLNPPKGICCECGEPAPEDENRCDRCYESRW